MGQYDIYKNGQRHAGPTDRVSAKSHAEFFNEKTAMYAPLRAGAKPERIQPKFNSATALLSAARRDPDEVYALYAEGLASKAAYEGAVKELNRKR